MEILNRRCGKRENSAVQNDVSVQTARCIGSCGLAPVAICDGAVLGRLTPQLLSVELKRIGVE